MDFYATLGDACAKRKTLEQMFQAGMTGVRVNLSHTSLSLCASLLKKSYWPAAGKRKRKGEKPHLILDMQGPELRVGELPRPISLKEGDELLLGDGGVPIPRAVLELARPGQEIVIDDSALLLEVRRSDPSVLLCRVVRGGALRSKKGLTLLNTQVDTPTLTQTDRENLARAGEFGVTHILQPFVRDRRDVETVRQTLSELGLSGVQIMAKIEDQQGLDHLDEIMESADQVCIARGDLGSAVPLWKLPRLQKEIARRCREKGKPFCLVTQLLWSMEQRPVPTRAEVCDIYNGVLDGASSLMLTGETAVGRWPVQAMEYLVRTAYEAMAEMMRQG